jgi:hypothetical protein
LTWCVKQKWARLFGIRDKPYIEVLYEGAKALEEDRLWDAPDTPTKRSGRPKKGETPKDSLVIAALAEHHGYKSGGSVRTYEPATESSLAKLHNGSDGRARLTKAAVSRFLQKRCGGYQQYAALCRQKRIGSLLGLWQGDIPDKRLLRLLPRESGREEDD